MSTLRTTAILKTDLSGSTARFRTLPEPDLTALLAEHRALLTRIAAEHEGHIVKPEGDGYWIVFPSVTGAALAAMAMQEELHVAEAGKGDRRLVMRVVITLGDVLHQEGALVGDAVVLAARIEALTPPDEIYLSAAAWLAVNQAEVRTALVDVFTLKGFPGPVPVYRVEHTYRTRVLEDQNIVVVDLQGFSSFYETASIAEAEKILDRLHEVVGGVCRDLGGVIRHSAGDSYCLTFPRPEVAIAAAERLVQAWPTPGSPGASRCALSMAVHRGVLYSFRDFLHSPDLNVAAAVERAFSRRPGREGIAFVTGQVRRALAGPAWDTRLQRVDVTLDARLAGMEIYRLDSRPAS
jgi:class 3 adenylate cyclase